MLYRLRQAIFNFMYGRYGLDRLGRATFIAYIIIAVLANVSAFFPKALTVRLVLSILSTLLLVILFYRMLSRNIAKRSNENAKYMKIRTRIFSNVSAITKGMRDRGHKYTVCKSCNAVVRFPRKKGNHTANCPKCGHFMNISIH